MPISLSSETGGLAPEIQKAINQTNCWRMFWAHTSEVGGRGISQKWYNRTADIYIVYLYDRDSRYKLMNFRNYAI